ncbi:MAG: hypothetical protein KDC44_04530, partial [Phaeodactylibacter sp.]|nr:hypothetical protein [Phaeodactylibacter sp.]
MKRHNFLYPLLLLTFFWSCTQDPAPEESTTPVETDIHKLDDSAITLTCVDVTQSGDKKPHNDVYINISGNKVRVGDVLICNTIDSTEYDKYGIPTEAICAVGGEVADDGVVVYAMRQREKYIVVRQGLKRMTENGIEYQHRALVNFSPENLS